jgi:hypothetical protein
MELNDIKKRFYKENHIAHILSVRKDGISYWTTIDVVNTINFFIPTEEIGEVIWESIMSAKHLIRYIVKE